MRHRHLVPLLLPALLAGCFSGAAEEPASTDLRVRRAAFRSEVVLSGELEAARGESLVVPRLPSWESSIKWIVEDGTAVRAGERVVELDNTALTAELEANRQNLTQTEQELQQSEAEWAADLEQKQLDLDKKNAELEKAEIDERVPREIISEREYETRQSALRRAKTAKEKSESILRSRRTSVASERANLLLKLEQARREIARAEEGIESVVLSAPRDGIVVVRDNPREGRKFQAGDGVWIGFTIATLPELSTLRLKAALADVDDGKVAVGMPVSVALDGYPGIDFKGRVSSISAIAQESRRTSLRRNFDVIITLDRLDPTRMRPGLSARATILREERPGALLVSRAAVDFTSSTPRVRLAGGSTKDVKLGPCNAFDCVVESGLEEGTRVASVAEVSRG